MFKLYHLAKVKHSKSIATMSAKAIQILDLNDFAEKNSSKVGKTDSIYVMVLFNVTTEDILNHCESKSQNALKIKDSYRRARARTAYYITRCAFETYDESDTHNLMVTIDVESNDLDMYQLMNVHIDLLRSYECDSIKMWRANHYAINEIRDYLESDEHFNLFRAKNNSVRHIKLGRTKKVVVDTYESRSMILADYIESKLTPTQKYMAYGMSSKLSPLTSSDMAIRAYVILNHDVSDTDAIEFMAKMDQADKLDDMDCTLDFMHNSKTMDRVIFKKDFIPLNISKLQKVYLDKTIEQRFYENCEKKQINISFEVIVIDSSIEDFSKGRESKLMADYGGVMGLTYY